MKEKLKEIIQEEIDEVLGNIRVGQRGGIFPAWGGKEEKVMERKKEMLEVIDEMFERFNPK